jgi:hypothetical protein
MLTRACLSFALLVAIPAWSQVAPAASGGNEIPDDDSRMPMPPMVSGQVFPTTTRSETRSDYLDARLAFEPEYYDNLLPGYGGTPISDFGYSIRPSIELDKLTPRLHQTWTYQPGFTLYQRTSARNEEDQNASVQVQNRLSQHTTLSGQDFFQKNSNVFNQPYSSSGEPISGAPPSSPADVIVPFADRLTNVANAVVAYQFSMNAMVGGGGTATIYDFLDQAQSPGLYNSNSRGGTAFYTRRMHGTQYIGVTYQYLRTLGHPEDTQIEIQTNVIFPFYSVLLEHRFSVSLAGGPLHYSFTDPALSPSGSWTPAITGSVAWQGYRTSLAASYSRFVTGGGGLLGVFKSNKASASARWQMLHTWSAGVGAGYSLYTNLSPLYSSAGQGGHSLSGTISFDHPLGERFTTSLGYRRLDQRYSSIEAISSDPNSDRAFISISYQLTKPLGR